MSSDELASAKGNSVEDDYRCYDEEHKAKCEAISTDLFGRQLTCSDLANLLGAFSDAQVEAHCGTYTISYARDYAKQVEGIWIKVRHKFYAEPQRRILFRDNDGAVVLYADLFIVDKRIAPPHTGPRVLARSLEALLHYNSNAEPAHKILRMRTHAYGSVENEYWNGAYTWARLGYNARLEDIHPGLKAKLIEDVQAPDYSDELREALLEVYTLNDLIFAGGTELWRNSGVMEFWGDFDISPSSASANILFSYIEEKGIEL